MEVPTNDLTTILEHYWQEEKRDFASDPNQSNHIFDALVVVRDWLEYQIGQELDLD